MEKKKSPHFEDAGNNKRQGKYTKKYLVNMPKKLGLPPGKKYYFTETTNGYSLNFGHGLYIGMPKQLIEDNPHLYTLVQKGGQL